MSENIVIHVATDFYPRPSGRYEKDGQFTGEAFREHFLVPKLNTILHTSSTSDSFLTIDFTGVTMAGSSFLEEAFGGLVRKNGFKKDDLYKILNIHSPKRPVIKSRIIEYIDEA